MKKSTCMSYEVVVVGGGPGGFPAAVAAARAGVKTLLVERNAFLGGTATSGLGNLGYIDRQGKPALGGIPVELLERLKSVGGAIGSFPCPVHNSITPLSPDMVKIVTSQMCCEAGVDVLYNAELSDVEVVNGRVIAISVLSKTVKFEIRSRVFIDATGDGDLAYLAGCRFRNGQSNGTMQPGTLMFTVTDYNLDAFFDYLERNPDDYGIKEDYAKGYNVDFFRRTKGHCFIGLQKLIERARENGDFDVPRNQFIYITTPSDKLLSINTSRVINLDAAEPLRLSEALAEGYEQVLQILRFMNKYVPGFEHAVISQISPTFGVRETRHFEGIECLTIGDIYTVKTEAASIGRCAYNIDVHSADSDTIDLTLVERSFGIPYGCLVPKDVDGLLLSGRIISVDSTVYAATRVMGPCMAVGQAAGVAAAQSAKSGTDVSGLSIAEIRKVLAAAGAVL